MGAHRIAAATAAGVLVVGLLAACDAGGDDSDGPDPADTAEALGTALASGEFTGVEFTDVTADAVSTQYAQLVEGLGEVTPTVEVGEVTESGESGESATAALAWTWPLGEQEWAYAAEATMRKVDDDWQVVWSPALVEPSSDEGGGARRTRSRPDEAAHPRRARAGAGRRAVGRPRFGIDRSQVPKARAGDSARQLATLAGIDLAPYVKQVEAAGDKAFVEAIAYRIEEVPPASRATSTASPARSPWRTSCRSRRRGSSRRRSSARSARSPPR